YMDTFRMPPYRRVDVGFSKDLIDKNKKSYQYDKKFGIKDAWIGFELYNLFDINNTISYFWISDIKNQMHAVPNYLTGRRINLKLGIRF
ncbi:MAG TPA: TonB-dependent receptor, partial [Prolixibacteraceae bacterium]|nr:TonB-dependent receptor [Prolixibacteraceae bacterium]